MVESASGGEPEDNDDNKTIASGSGNGGTRIFMGTPLFFLVQGKTNWHSISQSILYVYIMYCRRDVTVTRVCAGFRQYLVSAQCDAASSSSSRLASRLH